MKRKAVVTIGVFFVLVSLAACSSAAPLAAPESAATAGAESGSKETPAEAFDRECGSSSSLPRALEKPFASMGRSPKMVALLDGGFLIAGEREARALVQTPTRAVVVMRLDQEGTVAWEISLVHAAGRLAAKAIAETPDGGFAVLGLAELTREPRTYGWLTKLSADGKILWRTFFDATSGMDAEKTDRFVPKLAPYVFDRLEISGTARFVLSGKGAGAATAEIDSIGALGKVTPGGSSETAADGDPAAQLMDGEKAVVATLKAEELGRSCLKLRVLDVDGKLRAEEPLAAETQPGDRASIAAVGAYKVAVAFADVGALVLVVFQTER